MGVQSARVQGEANGTQTKKSYDMIYTQIMAEAARVSGE